MPKITVDHKTSSNADQAFEQIKEFFANDQDLRKIDPNIRMSFTDASKTGKATASQFSADFAVKAVADGATVSVSIDLPFILTPLKGKVKETLEKKLKKYLA